MFIYKTQEELSKMTPAEVDAYAAQLKAHEAETRKKEIEEATKGLASKEDLTSELLKATKAIEEVQEVVNQLKDASIGKGTKTVQTLKEVIESNKEAIKNLKGNKGNNVSFEVKAVATMTFPTHTTGQVGREDRENGITAEMRFFPTILDVISTGTTNGHTVSWVEQMAKEGSAAMTAEGAKKSQMDWTYEEKTATVKKVTAFIKISKEMLDDIDGIEQDIRRELIEALQDEVAEQVLNGDGLTNNLVGVTTNAVAFNANGLTVSNATLVDVLRIAIGQVRVAGANANAVVLNPFDAMSLELQKTTEGAYVLPPFTSADGMIIKGVRVIEDVNMDQGDFLVGDFTKSVLKFRENYTIDMGYENDDFTKNLVTILAEARLVNIIKEVHYPAFVKGSIAAAIASIDSTPSV